MKPFLRNKEIELGNSEIELAKTFNEYYVNIVQKSSGTKPKYISQCDENQNIHKTIREMSKSYENHPSKMQIKYICSSSFHVKEKFPFHFVNEIGIKKLI